MYIQITTRCNMTCEHCCFSATNRGEDMDRATYLQALHVAAGYGDFITIGGGEPTCHKEFIPFLDKAIELYRAGSFELAPHVVTNGKLKTKAHKMLDYVDEDRGLAVELSRDSFHDPIDPSVVSRFDRYAKHNRYGYYGGVGINGDSSAGVRTNHIIMPVGRALETGAYTSQETHHQCCCETPLVDPKGDVWSCGCKHTKLGSIWHDDILDGYDSEFAHTGGRGPIYDDHTDLNDDRMAGS